jgi:hypothetical protein
MWILQAGYVWHLFSKNSEYVTSAANVGSHFIFHNLLQFGWTMLWVRSHFWLSELLLIIDFFNLAFLYFRHSNYPRFIHIPVVSATLAWNFFAIFWNGATMVNAHTLVARIFANIAIWGLLVYGAFFLVVFKDYTIGFELSILTAGKLKLCEEHQLTNLLSSWGWTIPYSCHCIPMDIRLRHHGLAVRLYSPHLCPRPFRKVS